MNSRTAAYWPSATRSIARGPPAGSAARGSDCWLGSGGAGRPGTGYSCSPETCSAARLVTIALMLGRGAQQVGDDRGRPRRPARSCRGRAGGACRAASRPATRRSVARRALGDAEGAARSAARRASGSRIGSSGTKKTPSGKSSDALRGELERQPGLAGPARAGEGQQPGRGEQAGRLVELGVAADERRQLGRQVVRAGRRATGAAGKSAGRPSAMTWTIRTGALRSLSRCSPRSRSVTPSAGSVDELVADQARDAGSGRRGPAAAIRAARLMPSPTRLVAGLLGTRRCGGPSGPGSRRRPATARRPGRAAPATAAATASRRLVERDEERVALGALLVAAVGRARRAQDRPVALAELGVAVPSRRPARAASSPRCR